MRRGKRTFARIKRFALHNHLFFKVRYKADACELQARSNAAARSQGRKVLARRRRDGEGQERAVRRAAGGGGHRRR